MLTALTRDVRRFDPLNYKGRITRLEGLRIEATGPEQALVLGATARLSTPDGPRAEIVGFEDDKALLLACDPVDGLHPGASLFIDPRPAEVFPSERWLGRTMDAFADPIDDLGPLLPGPRPRPLLSAPPPASSRQRIETRLDLGVRVMDLFMPCGDGQRLGLFAGSGVGKSTLLSMLARGADADVIVIGLIGERGREVVEFIEDSLGPEGLARSVLVVATSDEPAPKRRRAAWLTLSIAEHFRDQGQRVLCLMDSLTRFAMAQREIGLAAGEPPTTRGYTPSVFAELPKLLERAGPGVRGQGSMTGLFTVLVEGDDTNEPISDAVRGIVDGHVVLSRSVAERGRYPAIDVLGSLSRLATQLQGKDEQLLIRDARRLMSLHRDMEELIRIGAYARGTDPDVDLAVTKVPEIEALLNQSTDDLTPAGDALHALQKILQGVGE